MGHDKDMGPVEGSNGSLRLLTHVSSSPSTGSPNVSQSFLDDRTTLFVGLGPTRGTTFATKSRNPTQVKEH